jgi:hypothetical protein
VFNIPRQFGPISRMPSRWAARVTASCGAGPALAGVLSSAFLERVAGGQPLLLRDRPGEGGQVVAVLLDPDSYAELESLLDEALA